MNARPILLIDQDAKWCAEVCRFLEPHGIPVVAAASIELGVHHLRPSLTPAAIVMDIAIREENRRDLAALRSVVGLGDVPVGYVRKSVAALDALLLMLPSSAASATGHAA
jgi:ActR/RegA family two-component response regulator